MYLLIHLLCLLAALSCAGANGPSLLPFGFAHNDYEHRRPLQEALDLGFCAVEADIFATNSSILVGHSAKDLRPERNLAHLYLEPLAQRARKNGNRVHRGGPELRALTADWFARNAHRLSLDSSLDRVAASYGVADASARS